MNQDVKNYLNEFFDELEKEFPTNDSGKHFIRRQNGKLFVWIHHNKGRFVKHDPIGISVITGNPKQAVSDIKKVFDKINPKPQVEKKDDNAEMVHQPKGIRIEKKGKKEISKKSKNR